MVSLFIFALGAVAGSFINVLASRLPREEEWYRGRSYCENCKQSLKPIDLIPILSFLMLQGRCRYCGESLSIREPLVELLAGVLLLATFWKWGISFPWFVASLFCFLLLLISVIDMEHQLIFDILVILLAGLALLWTKSWGNPVGHLLGSVIAGIVFWLIRWGGEKIWKKEAMGMGDVKLATALGLWMGWKGLYPLILFAGIFGLGAALFLLAFQKAEWGSEVPFGPFLCGAAALLLFFS